MKMFTPSTEGLDHINAYSKSRTELGRLLSNFEKSPFTCEDGQFESIEGYWYWLIAPEGHPKREELRGLHGFLAKKIGREISQKGWCDDETFKLKIKKALWHKTKSNSRLKELLLKNNLPIVHYYSYGDNPPKIITPKQGLWIWEAYETIKKNLINKEK